MNTTKMHRTVAELGDGRWMIKEWGRYYKTAAGARKALKREATRLATHWAEANLGEDWMFEQMVTWEPRTKSGWAIIRAMK